MGVEALGEMLQLAKPAAAAAFWNMGKGGICMGKLLRFFIILSSFSRLSMLLRPLWLALLVTKRLESESTCELKGLSVLMLLSVGTFRSLLSVSIMLPTELRAASTNMLAEEEAPAPLPDRRAEALL